MGNLRDYVATLDEAQRAALLIEVRAERAGRKLEDYAPYPKQLAFHVAGIYRERLFMAGNQLGKTIAGGYEVAMHATGRYPVWWQGRRFTKPIVCWVAGITGESTRDNPQRILLGRPGVFGTGAIPKSDIIATKAAMGVADLQDHVRVKHYDAQGKLDGESLISFKSYEKGREKWQGETLDLVWFDEEPPLDIYSEGLTRTNATGGMVFVTFTPLQGMSDVVHRYVMEKPQGTHVTNMTIDDAAHYTPEQRQAIIAAYPAHEREARAKGIPTLGSGRIFPIEDAAISEPTIQIPAYWPRIAAMDFGSDHPTACAWLAWDRDKDIIHVYHTHRLREAAVAVHAAAIKAQGAWIPVAWPHDGLNETAVGPALAKQYKAQGVNMRPENAKFPDDPRHPAKSRISVEAGITDMLTRMQEGRWKVAAHLHDWFEEFRMYHRKDGKIVKERDDLLSASRYALMDIRYAKVQAPKQLNVVANSIHDREMGY